MKEMLMVEAPRKATRTMIEPAAVRYIKLGEAGRWELECFERGIIRIGFSSDREARFAACAGRRWENVTESFRSEGKDQGTATRFTRELQLFFEDTGNTLWVTFMKERLLWGFMTADPARVHTDGDGVWRDIANGWQSRDILGGKLSKNRLAGWITKLAAYRGTSCGVDRSEYLVRRINGERSPEVDRVAGAMSELRLATQGLVKLLTWQDFELLVDLIFTTSGWRRVGELGRTQDTLDLDVRLPSTRERAFVQVKSATTASAFADYVDRFALRSDLYQRMFYVYHSGPALESDDQRVTVIGPEQLAEQVIDAGLVSWLVEKTS